ncbi:alpha/beta fold hydrolase [Cedecea neteri]|uniref:alpha/beta hydrolase family protein n=1 Tax=Cedecea neteri TaxID=158822 RepID=UPI002AA909FA|nr:alpha/beta fold hydrolase [Cedecea neteri]WPU22865.1 alpha/beta fold hydrolase [Cedecea neteri]
MSRIFFLFSLFCMFSQTAYGETAFRQHLLDEHGSRPLEIAVWYPTRQTGNPELVGDNVVFIGTRALLNASPDNDMHPLLLLSHGYGGNWRNLNWLASLMAAQGYIVAAVNHPGTTFGNKNEAEAQRLWQRPQDLRRVLDELIASPDIAGKIDPQRIAAIGHSLGGWTVLELAGGRFDADRFLQDCKLHSVLSGCKLRHILGIDRQESAAPLSNNARDPRIKAIVSLDLGLARGFSPSSLAQIAIPVLIMSAQSDSEELPASLESAYLARYIPQKQRQDVSVLGATHFSFMQLCKPGAAELIEKENPGEGIVCQDGGSVSRAAIHASLGREIGEFVNQALDFHPLNAGSPSGLIR